MTEEQWDACTEPTKMLEFLRDIGKASERKRRPFATGVARQVWGMLAHQAAFQAVELAERFADGDATEEELDVAWHGLRLLPEYEENLAIHAAAEALGSRAAARESLRSAPVYDLTYGPRAERQWVLLGLTSGVVWASVGAVSRAAGDEAGGMVAVRATDAAKQHRERLCGLVRDIFGNPYKPLTPLSLSLLGWSEGLVVNLAEAAYQHRSLPSGHLENARLAVLADALEDAGCTEDRLLAHLRSPGPHVRGCVGVDAVLGK